VILNDQIHGQGPGRLAGMLGGRSGSVKPSSRPVSGAHDLAAPESK